MAVSLCSKHELSQLDYALESILEKTKHDIDCTLFLSRYSDYLHDSCAKIAEKFNISYEPRGDNCVIDYNNEMKYKAFEHNNADTMFTIQPDTVFLKKDVFDTVVDEASQYFDEKFYVCVSSDLPDDTSPLGMVFHTKLGWEKIGCEDINFYPQAGGEHDCHRRSYLAWGGDPWDKEAYTAPLEGRIDAPWCHRIRCKDFMHVGKPWHSLDPRLETKRNLDYALQLFFESVLDECWGAYYAEKWGAVQKKERFIYPFDEEKYGYRIPWETSRNPYPEVRYRSLRGLII